MVSTGLVVALSSSMRQVDVVVRNAYIFVSGEHAQNDCNYTWRRKQIV